MNCATQLAHRHFRQIALHRVLEEFLVGLVLGEARRAHDERAGEAGTLADHYSQARMFFRSMSEPEQRHIVSAFAFELGKVETEAVRKRMLGHLERIAEIKASDPKRKEIQEIYETWWGATGMKRSRRPSSLTR
jgi:hypothetical protein